MRADDLAGKGRREPDEANVTTRTERMVFKRAGEQGSRPSVWTNGGCDMIINQASDAVLNRTLHVAAEQHMALAEAAVDEASSWAGVYDTQGGA